MNTYQAREQMRDLARQAGEIVRRLAGGGEASFDDRNTLRRLAVESREVLVDSGFPGAAAWRGIQRASIGLETQLSSSDPSFWRDVLTDLDASAEILDTPTRSRATDFNIGSSPAAASH